MQTLFWELGSTILPLDSIASFSIGLQQLFSNTTAITHAAPLLTRLFRAEQQLPQRVSVQPLPTPKIQYNAFFARAARLFALLFAFTFLFPATRLLRDVVVEKEERLREGMRIMGLTSAELMSSWYFTYAMIVIIQCVPIALIMKALIFKVLGVCVAANTTVVCGLA
jgi:hypothetical protein